MNAERLLALYERVADAPDAVPKLRRFVLDLAVRGKLVEQDPADEPATHAFKRISALREALPTTGRKLSPPKRKPHSIAGLGFDVPQTWRHATLSELVRVLNGRAYKRTELFDQGRTKVLRVGNLFTSDHWYYSELELEADKYCGPGDLIYAWSASFGPFIWTGPRVIYHYHIWKLDLFSEDDFSKQFLHLYLQQKTREIKESGHGISMVHMTKEKMEQLAVPFPPLGEQHRIVAKVDELMALLDRLEAARSAREATCDRLTTATLARLTASDTDAQALPTHARFALHVLPALTTRSDRITQLRKTILSLAVRGKLVPQDPSDEPASQLLSRLAAIRGHVAPSVRNQRQERVDNSISDLGFELPVQWGRAALSEILRVLNGRAYKRSELLDQGKTPVLRVGNLFTSDHWYHSDLELDADKYCDADDLIYAWSASFGPFIWQGPRVIYHYHIWKLDLFSSTDVDKRYLYLYLLHKTREIKESGHGISMLHMTKEKMEKLAVPLPPIAEQHRIVAKVDELMALCDRLEGALQATDHTRARLLEAVLRETLEGSAIVGIDASHAHKRAEGRPALTN